MIENLTNENFCLVSIDFCYYDVIKEQQRIEREERERRRKEAEIKREIEEQNRSAVEKILKRKNREDVYGLEDYDTTNMSEIKKEIIRTETKLGNLNPDDPNFRAKAKPLIDKIEALKNKMRE